MYLSLAAVFIIFTIILFLYLVCIFDIFVGRIITMDNFFTTVPLAEKLLKENLTIVETLRKCKRDIPAIMKPSKSREVHSSEFGFNNNLTMVSYCPKKGKAVILLSSMHSDKSVDGGEKKKPQIILYYNQTKGGVDTVDQMVRNYSCKRMTRRWPTVLWHNMLDIAALNALTIFKALQPNYMSGVTHVRRLFIKDLTKQLVMPFMIRRQATPSLQKPIKEAMKRCGLTFNYSNPVQQQQAPASKRKRCHICFYSKDRKVRCYCSQCHEAVCTEHSTTLVTCIKCKAE